MELLQAALRVARQALHAVEADAVRKADPAQRTPVDVFIAVLTLALTFALVMGCVGLGWWVLWRTTLHKIGMFRDLMGLNKAAKAESKRRAEAEIRALKSQLSRQHGFGTAPVPHDKGD